ncbi:MAG: hypothetical protein NC299_03395 [Lachnospiraceae bacterium]|nr:hypothetical protein [Ruminococcus sp.]MCM1165383.1 hypothetical protein [Ruminococcus sp.]MCM1274393.1 hypothetical protein [Lachnospiraceae bacterium]MCM1274394.1 hypothetical protein [Lachnospiraceae bacterium]
MKRNSVNECKVRFPALSRNEGLSRSAAAAFAMQCDPTVEAELFMRLCSDNAAYKIKNHTAAVIRLSGLGALIVEPKKQEAKL